LEVLLYNLQKKYLEVGELATTASEHKFELCRNLGADVIINYKTENFSEKLKNYDVAFDTTGEAWKMMEIVKPKIGTVISISTIPSAGEVANHNLTWYAESILNTLSSIWRFKAWLSSINYNYCFVQPNGEQLELIGQLYAKGLIKTVTDKSFPLAEAPEALNYLQKGHATGKVIIIVKQEKHEML